jgi:hypothetical protein
MTPARVRSSLALCVVRRRGRGDPGQRLDQDIARDDSGRRGQEHDAGPPEGRQARPNEALCDVARNALRTLDAPGQVRTGCRHSLPEQLIS